ncbi:unnamed protein product [Amoebophrya sp. A25]|nr:unnamed protein product [Amoebophrya sp. A25]|eukprot:GSA25T00010902001.1
MELRLLSDGPPATTSKTAWLRDGQIQGRDRSNVFVIGVHRRRGISLKHFSVYYCVQTGPLDSTDAQLDYLCFPYKSLRIYKIKIFSKMKNTEAYNIIEEVEADFKQIDYQVVKIHRCWIGNISVVL